MAHAKNCENILLTHDASGALLTVRCQAAICELIAGQTLLFDDHGVFKNREKKT